MASGGLFSSFLRSCLRRIPPESALTNSRNSFSTSVDLTRPFSAINQSRIYCQKEPSPGFGGSRLGFLQQATFLPPFPSRCITTESSAESTAQGVSSSVSDGAPRIKFKRLDKTAKHIMQILDKEAREAVLALREIPDIKPGYIVQLKVEVPENKRRVSVLKGIVIARRNAGLNTTFRIRRLVAGVGVESMYPLYSPNIKEIKVLDKKRVRRAKLYYLRDKLNALKKQ